jgi:hypothetical protein
MAVPQSREFENFSFDIRVGKFSVIFLVLNFLAATNIVKECLKNSLDDLPSISPLLTGIMIILLPIIILMTTKNLLRNMLRVPVPKGNLFQYC